MRTFYFLLLMALCFSRCDVGKNSSGQNGRNNQIVIGKIDKIYSEILGEDRKVWVHVPKNANKFKKYPVVYLLDGPGHFYSVVGMIKQLSTTNGNTVLPEMIVVAIPNTDRIRDLSPSMAINFLSEEDIFDTSGGGDLFLDFIEKELVPYIEQSYPATPYRTYIGHSLGGLSVIQALVSRTHLFNNYIAIDPSLWWNDQTFLDFADSVLSEKRFENKALYVGIANTLSDSMDIETVRGDTTSSTMHIRSILQFVEEVGKKENGLRFDWKYYANDDHGSVPLITAYDAMRFLFDWHQFKGTAHLFDTTVSVSQAVDVVKAHYEKLSGYFEYEVLPDQELVATLGYYFIDNKMPDKAAALFDLNIASYPNSSKAFNSRADCYLATGDTLKALEFYNKAYEKEKNDYSPKKIDELTKQD